MSLDVIKALVEKEEKVLGLSDGSTKVIAVSKLQPNDRVRHVLDSGHRVFGENRVQEALRKWPEFKNKYDGVELHLLGPLQRNKVRQAMSLFDYIHTVDSLKLVKKIAEIRDEISFCPKLFIQVNIGNEEQKSGISLEEVQNLYNNCLKLDLNVIGLMCLPPLDNKTSTYFKNIKNMNDNLSMNELSIGMSNDYLEAVEFKATFLRIGTKIFGDRD